MKKALLILSVLFLLASCSNTMTDLPEQSRMALTTSGTDALCLVGDSRVYLWPDGYFTDWNVTNIGVGGTTSVFSACAIQRQAVWYDTMIISVGINDYGNDMTLSDSVNALASCLAWASVRADHVYITSIPGVRQSSTISALRAYQVSYRAAQINTFLPTLAASHGATLIHLSGLIGSGWYLSPAYDCGDGVHYNAAGYDAIAELYEGYIGGE